MTRIAKIALILPLILFCSVDTGAQDTLQFATDKDKKIKLPHRATMLAASLPGMGQVYNQKYWKIPVVYAGFAALGYAAWFNSRSFNDYSLAYLDFTDVVPETDSYLGIIKGISPDTFDPVLYPETAIPSETQRVEEFIISGVDYYRRYRDLSFIGIAAWYLITIIDANVDASLSDYDVGKNLNLSFLPDASKTYAGHAITLNLKLVKSF